MIGGISFIHKDGRIIPIRQTEGKTAIQEAAQAKVRQVRAVGHVAGKAIGAAKFHVEHGLESIGLKKQPVVPNRYLDAAGLGLSVASGTFAAATFSKGGRGIIAGLLGSHAIDVVGVGVNLASVAGKGQRKERLKQAAHQEARNFIIGNGIFVAGLLGLKANREVLKAGAKGVARRIISFGRKAMVAQ